MCDSIEGRTSAALSLSVLTVSAQGVFVLYVLRLQYYQLLALKAVRVRDLRYTFEGLLPAPADPLTDEEAAAIQSPMVEQASSSSTAVEAAAPALVSAPSTSSAKPSKWYLYLVGSRCHMASCDLLNLGVAHTHRMWGSCPNGQLQLEPTPLTMLENVTIVSVCCGSDHTLMLSDTGRVYGFGEHLYGAIGSRSSDSSTVRTIAMPGDVRVKQIAAGATFSACLTETGNVVLFGTRAPILPASGIHFSTAPTLRDTEVHRWSGQGGCFDEEVGTVHCAGAPQRAHSWNRMWCYAYATIAGRW